MASAGVGELFGGTVNPGWGADWPVAPETGAQKTEAEWVEKRGMEGGSGKPLGSAMCNASALSQEEGRSWKSGPGLGVRGGQW